MCVAFPGVAAFGGYVVVPLLGMLAAALLIGLPLQNRRVNDFVVDAGYLGVAYVVGLVLRLTGFPFEDQFWLNATLSAASIVLQVVGWSALIRRALGYRQWKSDTEWQNARAMNT